MSDRSKTPTHSSPALPPKGRASKNRSPKYKRKRDGRFNLAAPNNKAANGEDIDIVAIPSTIRHDGWWLWQPATAQHAEGDRATIILFPGYSRRATWQMRKTKTSKFISTHLSPKKDRR